MTLLASDAIAHIRHTLASQDVPSVGALRILNDAGHYLLSAHNWAWCEGAQAELPLTAGQPYVWLPDDFREIISVQAVESLNAGFILTTQDRILKLRALATASSFHYHAALVHAQMAKAATATVTFTVGPVATTGGVAISDGYNPTVVFKFLEVPLVDTDVASYLPLPATIAAGAQALADSINNKATVYVSATVSGAVVSITHDRPGLAGNAMTIVEDVASDRIEISVTATGTVSGPPLPRLDIWPEPGTSEAVGLRVYYRSGWMRVTGDNVMLRLPEWLEALYLQVVRAFARGYERESDAGADQRIAAIAEGPLMAAAKLRDSEMLPNIGPLQGGAVLRTRVGEDPVWNFSSTGGPS
tara:strand:+ start:10225 stop:11298 length:1074 start_codon:yes stop_codon:yes gene_type:complete